MAQRGPWREERERVTTQQEMTRLVLDEVRVKHPRAVRPVAAILVVLFALLFAGDGLIAAGVPSPAIVGLGVLLLIMIPIASVLFDRRKPQ
jgi:protein-S-isoprenylcysteine O-methyltransferase Ste14